MTYQRQQQVMEMGSRGVAAVALVLGIIFFWLGPSAPPGRPMISLACFIVAVSAAFMAFAYYCANKIRESRPRGGGNPIAIRRHERHSAE